MENPYESPSSMDEEQYERPPLAAPLEKKGSFLSRQAWTVYALGVAVIVVLQPFQPTGSIPFERLLPYLFGKILGLTSISLVPALLVYYLSRRSRKAASTTFTIFVVLCILGQVGEAMSNLDGDNGPPPRAAAPNQPGE